MRKLKIAIIIITDVVVRYYCNQIPVAIFHCQDQLLLNIRLKQFDQLIERVLI